MKNLKIIVLSISILILHIPFCSGHTNNLYGLAQAQGRRPTMEDAHDIHTDSAYAFFGLYDGHGGRKVADYVANNLYGNIRDRLTNSDTNVRIRRSLRKGFLKTNNALALLPFAQKQGCTAIVALIHRGKLFVANAGDSRAVLCRGHKAIALSRDHKPDRPDEKKRIERLGGTVTVHGVARVNGILAVSRAFGDMTLSPYVTAAPEIRTAPITSRDRFLILACDGVWDVLSNQEAVTLVKKSLHTNNNNFEHAAQDLKDAALEKGSTDNVSVILVNLQQLYQSDRMAQTHP